MVVAKGEPFLTLGYYKIKSNVTASFSYQKAKARNWFLNPKSIKADVEEAVLEFQ